MMRQIAAELDNATAALSGAPFPPGHRRRMVLDLCMAPGGFTLGAMIACRDAHIRAISLPPSAGGHKVLLKESRGEKRVTVQFLDITMLAVEMGVSLAEIAPTHPDAGNFLSDRPYLGEQFDLVFCDGQVLRGHARHCYREKREATRLATSQLVLALSRIRPGGTLVMLMHKAEAWDSFQLLRVFSKISTSVTLFKPQMKHAIRSSFYLVAKGVDPTHPDALTATSDWKQAWFVATFGDENEFCGQRRALPEDIEKAIGDFGAEFVRMAKPIWKIQAAALERASFTKPARPRNTKANSLPDPHPRDMAIGVEAETPG